MDLSDVVYIDETSSEKGHGYVTLSVCEGNSLETMDRLAVDRRRTTRGGGENIGFASYDLGEAYSSGVRRNFSKARIIYDEFHAVAHY